MKKLAAPFLAAVFLSCAQAFGAIVSLDLLGKGGTGLLPGNENSSVLGVPGRGGERSAGILFNDSTRILTIDIGWGSGNGFTDLTSAATAGHIHGPTTSGGTASFTQDAGVLITLDTLPGWNSSRTNGGLTGTVTLTATQATDLLAGKYYINVHTSTNGGGEIRGNLVVVPEPTAAGLAVAGLGASALRRRRGIQS
jgi:hypothetical protein